VVRAQSIYCQLNRGISNGQAEVSRAGETPHEVIEILPDAEQRKVLLFIDLGLIAII